MPTISKENYLKAIYALSMENGNNVSTARIAQRLEITNAATSEMARKLAKKEYLTYQRYKGVELTQKGKKIALQIIRRHRLWEVFLINELGLDWGEVHDEAERLEHNTSDFLIDKIEEHLGFPEFDPHGHPIPNKKGNIPEMPNLDQLSNCEVNKKYQMFRVDDEDNKMIEYLSKLGLVLYKKFKVVEILPFDNSVVIEMDGKEFSVSEKVAEKVSVVKINKD